MSSNGEIREEPGDENQGNLNEVQYIIDDNQVASNLPRGEETHDNIAVMTNNQHTRPEVVFVVNDVERETQLDPRIMLQRHLTEVDYVNYANIMKVLDLKMGSEVSMTELMLKKDLIGHSER